MNPGRKGANRARAQKANKFIVDDHFTKLQKLLANNNLLDFPEKFKTWMRRNVGYTYLKIHRYLQKKGPSAYTLLEKNMAKMLLL